MWMFELFWNITGSAFRTDLTFLRLRSWAQCSPDFLNGFFVLKEGGSQHLSGLRMFSMQVFVCKMNTFKNTGCLR